jgi:YD repeat-containing protein
MHRLLGKRRRRPYDDAGRITQLENPQNELTTYQYDDADRRTAIIRHNMGNRTSISYDLASQNTEIMRRNLAGAIITAFTYTYDDAGVRTSVRIPSVVVSWTYDDAYRLTNETVLVSGSVFNASTMTYDEVGNRTLL